MVVVGIFPPLKWKKNFTKNKNYLLIYMNLESRPFPFKPVTRSRMIRCVQVRICRNIPQRNLFILRKSVSKHNTFIMFLCYVACVMYDIYKCFNWVKREYVIKYIQKFIKFVSKTAEGHNYFHGLVYRL